MSKLGKNLIQICGKKQVIDGKFSEKYSNQEILDFPKIRHLLILILNLSINIYGYQCSRNSVQKNSQLSLSLRISAKTPFAFPLS
jgi:hypothetical protein